MSIRALIGKLFSSDDIYEIDGEFFISCYLKDEYRFNYRKVKQNWFGLWVKQDLWLSKNVPLKIRRVSDG